METYRGFIIKTRVGPYSTVIGVLWRSGITLDLVTGTSKEDAIQKARNLIDGLLEQ